jgi:2'-5' RNA ligase
MQATEGNRPVTSRLFVALWPPDGVRDALRAARDAWMWPPGSALVSDQRLHLTLHFLGAVPRARIDALMPALDVGVPPFELRFGRPALWPHGIAVLEPARAPARLLQLHASLADALRGAGIAVEARPFRPHVTLARRAIGAAPPVEAEPLRWRARGHALVESAGGGYRVLRRYPAAR